MQILAPKNSPKIQLSVRYTVLLCKLNLLRVIIDDKFDRKLSGCWGRRWLLIKNKN